MYPRYSEAKQVSYFINSYQNLFYNPRIHGSNALNIAFANVNELIHKFSNCTSLLQLFPHKFNRSFYSSSNAFRIYTIHNDINTSIFYFHKVSNSTDFINFSSISKNIRNSKRKNIIQNKKIIKEIYYHNNTKPLIIFCRVDTNPTGNSTYDSTIHIFAMIQAIKSIFDSKKIANKIKHDFAFVFTSCQELDQLGTKNLMKNIFRGGGYYLYLSGIGAGRPFALYSQSKKSSSVIKALSKVSRLPMATFISEFEGLISLIKAKSYSMTECKQATTSKIDYKQKSKSKSTNIYNSHSEIKNKINSNLLNLNILKKLGNEKEIYRYKNRYYYYSGATRIQKRKNFSGAELSFIGNPYLHSTAMDVDNDEHNMKNIQLVSNCILQFLTHFNPNSGSAKDNISKESYLLAFGISPFVFLIQKENLNVLSLLLFVFFCFYIVFYLMIQIFYNLNGLKSEQIEKVDIFKSISYVFINEFSFVFYFFLALISTFIFHLLFFLLLSVMNPSSMMCSPNAYFFLVVFSLFSVFIYIFEYFNKHKKSNITQNYNINCYLNDDWHFLQVFYMTILLVIFKKFDFEILIVETAIFFILFQFCPIHKNMIWTPIILSIIILSPLIYTYSLLYKPFLLDCQNLPIFYADTVPYIFIFIFFIHMSVFILPFYFMKENENENASIEIKSERLKIHYLCSISEICLIFNKINFSTSKNEIPNVEKKSDDKKIINTNGKTNGIKKRNKLKKNEISTNSNTNPVNVSNNNNNINNNNNVLIGFKSRIETIISPRLLIFIDFIILFYFIFIKSPSFSSTFPIKGTFAHYYIKDSNKSEISFIPKSGRRSIPFLWKSLLDNSNIKYVYNYDGRFLTNPKPAIVNIIENSTLPNFFTAWPQISLSSIQHDVPTKHPFSFEENVNDNDKKKRKMVRKIIFNLNSMGANVNYIYFIFKCGPNSIAGQCVDSRLSVVDPIDFTTISYSSKLKNEEKLFMPFYSNKGETVFRIGSFIGYPTKRVPHVEINVTENTPIKLSIVYQSFMESKEMKAFKSRFNKLVVNEINENEITQSVFIQTQMI